MIDGRRWRRTDPGIPEPLRRELVRRLMHGRRAVAAALRTRDAKAEREARAQVHDAKLALGERGAAWWDEPTEKALTERAAAIVRTLARERQPRGVSPTEVARVLGGALRTGVPLARTAMRELAGDGQVELTVRGARMTARLP